MPQRLSSPKGVWTDVFHALAFLLTGGNVADCTAADALLDRMPATSILHGDKGSDSNAVSRMISGDELK